MEVGSGDRWIQREQPFGSIALAVGCGFDESVDCGGELERQLLDVLAQRLPRIETVLAGDHRLRVVQRDRPAREVGI